MDSDNFKNFVIEFSKKLKMGNIGESNGENFVFEKLEEFIKEKNKDKEIILFYNKNSFPDIVLFDIKNFSFSHGPFNKKERKEFLLNNRNKKYMSVSFIVSTKEEKSILIEIRNQDLKKSLKEISEKFLQECIFNCIEIKSAESQENIKIPEFSSTRPDEKFIRVKIEIHSFSVSEKFSNIRKKMKNEINKIELSNLYYLIINYVKEGKPESRKIKRISLIHKNEFLNKTSGEESHDIFQFENFNDKQEYLKELKVKELGFKELIFKIEGIVKEKNNFFSDKEIELIRKEINTEFYKILECDIKGVKTRMRFFYKLINTGINLDDEDKDVFIWNIKIDDNGNLVKEKVIK